MKSLYTLLIVFLSVQIGFTQSDGNPNSPYYNAPEDVKRTKAFQRQKWFYETRMLPSGRLPENAYRRGLEERNALRNHNGFYLDNTYSWISIGPTPGAYSLNGAISSRIATIKYDPSNPDIVYIGAAYGGVWKSTDAGSNWFSVSDHEASLSSGSIAIDPVNTSIIYYGTGEASYSGASYTGLGILKSTNGGATWTNYTAGLPATTYFSRLVIRPNHGNELFAAMGTRGFYKSTNAGVSWTQLLSVRTDDIFFTPTGDSCYVIGNGSGYRISTDGGNTFNQSSPFQLGTRNHFGFCKSKPHVIYAATYDGELGSEVAVYKSTNAGINYARVGDSFDFDGFQAWYDFYVHVSPFDENFAIIGTFSIVRTTDGGASFEYIDGNDVHVDQHNLDFHPFDPNRMIVANDGGVWRSTDRGNTWMNLNNTLNLTQFYKIGSHPVNPAYLMGGTQDNGTQKTTGTIAWSSAFGGDGGEVVFHPVDPNFILGETQYNGVVRSTDGGMSFSGGTNGLFGTGNWVAPIIAHPSEPQTFYTGRQAIFKTTDGAAFWQSISTTGIGTAREMDICKNFPDVIYSTSGSTIYKSTDGGVIFANITSGLPTSTITDVKVHPDSSGVVWVSLSSITSKIFKSTNGGQTWVNKTGNLPASPGNDIEIPFWSNTNVIVFAVDHGVFITTNDGQSWTEIADNLPNTICEELDYHRASGKLRIGTHGRGVWELNGPITGVPVINSFAADNYSLSDNFPNPFNPVTKFRFSIPERLTVRIDVHDMSGRLVRTLTNNVMERGKYEIEFNAYDISSGTYIYTINAGSFRESKKMILIK